MVDAQYFDALANSGEREMRGSDPHAAEAYFARAVSYYHKK
jgi:hypothetical protein